MEGRAPRVRGKYDVIYLKILSASETFAYAITIFMYSKNIIGIPCSLCHGLAELVPPSFNC